MCEWPSVEVPTWMLLRAQEAVASGIALLQQAQETPWVSVAADAMREELYAAIQLLRAIDAAIDDARLEVAGVRVALADVDRLAA
jgi:hypothetical protein